MLNIKICLFVGRITESPLHKLSIVRMNSLKYQFQSWLNRSIVFKEVAGFFRPVDLSAADAPAETAGVAYVCASARKAWLRFRSE